MKQSRMRWIYLFLVICVGMTACSDQIPAYMHNPALKNLSAQQRALLSDMCQSHIQVIKHGMRFTFVIPTDYFFERTTRTLRPSREKALDRLAQFIHDYTRYFEHPAVRVSGYTDTVWLSPARDMLSLHYANAVAEFLREDGIASEIIQMRGEGAHHPIASNKDPEGAMYNRRVVVQVG